MRRKRGNKKIICSGCGQRVDNIHEICEREVRDLPVFQFRTTIVLELYRVRCPKCGPKMERVEQLPGKALFSKRFEEAVGQACEGASARQVARWFRLSESMAGHRPALSGALGGSTEATGYATDGRG